MSELIKRIITTMQEDNQRTIMKFQIEQIALCPANHTAAMELLTALGAGAWALDHVKAQGEVFGNPDRTNAADLSFNYDLCAGKELEVLHYTDGDNWMRDLLRVNSVSHLGCHCTEEELEEFRAFFKGRGIDVAQEVRTSSHTNPVIAGKRLYHYCIFDTRSILGVDLKFIVRKDV